MIGVGAPGIERAQFERVELSGAELDLGLLELRRTGTVSVRVTGNGGRAIKGAAVQLVRSPRPRADRGIERTVPVQAESGWPRVHRRERPALRVEVGRAREGLLGPHRGAPAPFREVRGRRRAHLREARALIPCTPLTNGWRRSTWGRKPH